MKKIRTLAGMAVFALGVMATSSCSKDEFFGLEDSEVIDASTKYKIAMSQEYADYAMACYEMTKAMNQPVDTSRMKYAGEVKGKPVYIKEGPSASAMALLEILKKKYPEMSLADKMDFDEITNLALANNEALKDIVPNNNRISKGKSKGLSSYCGQWALSVGHYYGCFSSNYWNFSCNYQGTWAIVDAIYYASEWENSDRWSAGIAFNDGSAVSMNAYLSEYWPEIINTGSPLPEYDFIVIPYYGNNSFDFDQIVYAAGEEYVEGDRLHYILTYEGGNPLDYYSYFCYAYWVDD